MSQFPAVAMRRSDAMRLPYGIAHTAHAGGAPIASLTPATVIRAQHADLSYDTLAQFPAEKFDKVPMHQTQLRGPGGRVALDFNDGVFEG